MRTTLTLEEDLASSLKETARRTGRSFKEVVNSTLRRGLGRGEEAAKPLPRFKVEAKACGFRPGIDLEKLNQLYDELETEDYARGFAKAGRHDPS